MVEALSHFEREGLVFDVRDGGPRDGSDGDHAVVLLHGFPQDSTAWTAVEPALHAAGLRTLAPDQRGYSPPPAPPAWRRTGSARCRRTSWRSSTPRASGGRTWSATTGAARWSGTPSSGTPTGSRAPSSCRRRTRPRSRGRSRTARKPSEARTWGCSRCPCSRSSPWHRRWSRRSRRRGSRPSAPDTTPGACANPGRSPARWGGTGPSAPDSCSAWRLQHCAGGRLEERRQRWHGPTTYVWGQHDPTLGRAAAERTSRYARGDYRFVELDGGHWLPETHPDEVAAEILTRALPHRPSSR